MTKTRDAVAITLAVAAGMVAPAHASGRFACHTLPLTHCHYIVLHADGHRTEFVLRSGEIRELETATPGVDRYVMSVGGPPPADFDLCARRQFNGRRSDWCKAGVVGPGQAQATHPAR